SPTASPSAASSVRALASSKSASSFRERSISSVRNLRRCITGWVACGLLQKSGAASLSSSSPSSLRFPSRSKIPSQLGGLGAEGVESGMLLFDGSHLRGYPLRRDDVRRLLSIIFPTPR